MYKPSSDLQNGDTACSRRGNLPDIQGKQRCLGGTCHSQDVRVVCVEILLERQPERLWDVDVRIAQRDMQKGVPPPRDITCCQLASPHESDQSVADLPRQAGSTQ